MVKTYSISEIATLTRLSAPTLRYYESIGLIHPVRNEANYRIFTDQDIRWLTFIKRAKATGMPLSKIITYAQLRKQGNSTIAARINLLRQQEQLLRSEKAKIQQHIDF
ncbi:transcriptional regulator [Leuconostoc citreum]|uniref:Transcriptional regulator n=1 Tax=Leuconostoc citreum TaxID=33964 RepID=A0A5A5TZX1_LEUCI|nr:MerR family transcriptional regulator [Leuconostoc citreum]GDZ84237.1 transcriptional regulator [Leuconostoc citreum]